MKHRGPHIWTEGLKGEAVGTTEQWRKDEAVILTMLIGKTCKKCGKEERELKVIAEAR